MRQTDIELLLNCRNGKSMYRPLEDSRPEAQPDPRAALQRDALARLQSRAAEGDTAVADLLTVLGLE